MCILKVLQQSTGTLQWLNMLGEGGSTFGARLINHKYLHMHARLWRNDTNDMFMENLKVNQTDVLHLPTCSR